MNDAASKPRYNRMLLDMHIPDWDPAFLSRYEPTQVVAAQVAARAGSVMVYCQSHLGLCYWPTTRGRVHQAMGNRDWLGESLAALRQAGQEVFGYYSVIFNNDAEKEHPAWRIEPRPSPPGWQYARDRYGQVCPNNIEYRHFVETQLADLFSRYRFDGFFFDMTFWRGVCLCPSCRVRFRNENDAEIPSRIDWADPAWCAFQTARERWLIEFTDFLNGIARQHGVALVYHNFAVALFNWKFGMTTELGEINDMLGGDFYGDADEQFMVSRYLLNLSKTRPIEFMTSRCVQLTDHVSTKSTAQLQSQAFAALASSAAFRLIDAIDPQGTICDAVYPILARVFERLEPYHPWLGGEPVEDVVVYVSDASKMNLAESGRELNDATALTMPSSHLTAARGALTALREQRIPVGVITSKQIDRLANYRVVVLAEVVRMSPAEAAAFTAYVADGGQLYVSGATGTYTLTGRADGFLLSECLGLDHRSTLPGNMFYLRPTNEAWRSLCAPQTTVCVHEGVQEIALRARAVEVLGTVTLPYEYPHEGTLEDHHWASIHSAPPGATTEMPAVTRHRYGDGCAIYAASVLERDKHHVAKRTFQWLIASLLTEGPSFHVETYDHVWLTVFHQLDQQRFVLHLLNYPANLPAVPVRNVRIVIRRGAAMTLGRLFRAPDGLDLSLTDCGRTHAEATLDELADYAMLVLEYRIR